MISLIVAAAENDVIGVGGALPWRLSDDLRRFKRLTMGKPVVMGRKTWESIGRPLPGRRNIVITGQRDYVAAGCDVVASPAAAIAAAGDADEIMIIGGGHVYETFLPQAGRIYLTRVHASVDGDAFLPALGAEWRESSREARGADEANDHAVTYLTLERDPSRPGT